MAVTTESEIRTVRVAALAVAVLAIGWWAVLVSNGSQAGVSLTLFASRDVAAMYILASIPLATLLVVRLRERCQTRGLAIVAVLAPAVFLCLFRSQSIDGDSAFVETITIGLLRVVTALTLDLAAISVLTLLLLATWQSLTGTGFQGSPNLPFITTGAIEPAQAPTKRHAFLIACSMGFVAATIVPTAYVAARCRHDAVELGELLDQSRLGEAKLLVRDLLRLAPTLEWRGRSLKSLETELERQVRELELHLDQSWQNAETDEEQLQRCQRLAMLGRTTEALAGLARLRQSPIGPAACNLSGLIHETTAQWETARGFHRRARQALLRQPSTPERDAAILQATTRLGYCERKLGNYLLAEAEYREVLARSPTADSHFLLAQFYEDMQQSTKARAHARRAMSLAPRRYEREGTALVNKLVTGHFGCLGVYTAESAAGRSAMVSAKH